jgi:hypothetical protein
VGSIATELVGYWLLRAKLVERALRPLVPALDKEERERMKSAITEARIRLEVCSTVRLFRVRSDVEVGAADPLLRAIRGQNVEGKKI